MSCLHGAAAALPDILLCPTDEPAAWPDERRCHAEVVDVLVVGGAAALGEDRAEMQGEGIAESCGTGEASLKGLGVIR